MNYTKPEVAVLGPAVRVIERVIGKQPTGTFDGKPLPPNKVLPAYDLDE
jgi:hypothetical protein